MLGSILEELRGIRSHLEGLDQQASDFTELRDRQDRPAA
jgi:hypothetical protein